MVREVQGITNRSSLNGGGGGGGARMPRNTTTPSRTRLHLGVGGDRGLIRHWMMWNKEQSGSLLDYTAFI